MNSCFPLRIKYCNNVHTLTWNAVIIMVRFRINYCSHKNTQLLAVPALAFPLAWTYNSFYSQIPFAHELSLGVSGVLFFFLCLGTSTQISNDNSIIYLMVSFTRSFKFTLDTTFNFTTKQVDKKTLSRTGVYNNSWKCSLDYSWGDSYIPPFTREL